MYKSEIKNLRHLERKQNLSRKMEEDLMHIVLISYNKEIGRSIYLFPSLNKSIKPYFLVFNSTWLFDATKCCRISCIEPKYIFPKDVHLPYFILKEKDIAWIMEEFKEKWNDMIRSYYLDQDWDLPDSYDPEPIPIPNYYELLNITNNKA